MKTISKTVLTFVTVAFGLALAAINANAACVSPSRFVPSRDIAMPAMGDLKSAVSADGNDQGATPTIVGIFNSILYAGPGPNIYDQQFDQWFSDGNEVALTGGLPPVLGNVCLGVWKKTGARTYKLRHFAWNFDFGGNLIGSFILIETVTLDDKGNGYSGVYSADSFDLGGNLLSDQHAEGVVRARRLSVSSPRSRGRRRS